MILQNGITFDQINLLIWSYNIITTMRNHMKSKQQSTEDRQLSITASRLQVSAAVVRVIRDDNLSNSKMILRYILPLSFL